MINLQKLKNIIPDAVLNEIPVVSEKFEINTPLRLAHFLGQCAHESGNFKVTVENLNYSADGLKKIFGKYFPGTLNETYARKPEAIASRVYASRMGNSDEASKNGYVYRGRGYVQLTGKNAYEKFGKSINEDLLSNPDLVATKYPLLSAAWFWSNNNLNILADKGSDITSIDAITKKVNGGLNGAEDRRTQVIKFYNLLK